MLGVLMNLRTLAMLFLCIITIVSSGWSQDSSTPDFQEFRSGRIIVGGVVKPAQEAILSFVRPGTIVSIPEICQRVRVGETIAKISDSQAKNDLAQAEAELESARLSIAAAQHQRDKTMRLLDENILSSIALTEIDFSVKQAEINL